VERAMGIEPMNPYSALAFPSGDQMVTSSEQGCV